MARMTGKSAYIKPGMTPIEKLMAGARQTIKVHGEIEGIIKEALKGDKTKYDLQAALREIRHRL